MSVKTKCPYFMILASLAMFCCAGMKPNPTFNESSRKKSRHNHNNSVSISAQRLQSEIESYLGVPYRWGGTTRSGMDCSGLVQTVFHSALKVKLPRKARDMFKQGSPVGRRELTFGDLVFFEKIETYGISHVGIYLGNDTFAHASTTRGVVISNLNDKYYRVRYAGARRILTRIAK
ncbi:MAG: C40 family peptidase [bacterium]